MFLSETLRDPTSRFLPFAPLKQKHRCGSDMSSRIFLSEIPRPHLGIAKRYTCGSDNAKDLALAKSFVFCPPTRDRTWDLILKRDLLYQLSYGRKQHGMLFPLELRLSETIHNASYRNAFTIFSQRYLIPLSHMIVRVRVIGVTSVVPEQRGSGSVPSREIVYVPGGNAFLNIPVLSVLISYAV